MSKIKGVTVRRSEGLERIWQVLNSELFGGKLPDVMIAPIFKLRTDSKLLQKAHSDDVSGELKYEVQINAQLLINGTVDVCQALFCEQLHLWELAQTLKPPTERYRSGYWVNLARELGFEADKDCGRYVKLTPRIDGFFMKAVSKVDEMKLPLPTNATQYDQKPEDEPQKKDKNLQKWVCPECEMNVRGASGINVLCGVHRRKLVLQPKQGN